MKRRWEMLVVGIVIGLIAGKTYEAVAQAITFSYNSYVPDRFLLKAKDEPWKVIMDASAMHFESFTANHFVALFDIHTTQVVVRGIDLRLFNENMIGLLREKHVISDDEARLLIDRSTVEAAQFTVLKNQE